jgi:succinate dehydrogenase flavin-adding protein (antitoxin of CptAB toxin-antitoxin module)
MFFYATLKTKLPRENHHIRVVAKWLTTLRKSATCNYEKLLHLNYENLLVWIYEKLPHQSYRLQQVVRINIWNSVRQYFEGLRLWF